MESVKAVIVPPSREIDGFPVQRALPTRGQRMIGPFAFFDQMGPAILKGGSGLDVRPHPHIGLATVTYLFAGALLHRDSLGTVQQILPAEVNWMTAGSGIVHSERTPPELRGGGSELFGIQVWVALPKADEETDPAFAHHAAEALPRQDGDGLQLRLIAGSMGTLRSPVPTFSEMLYADLVMEPGARFEFEAKQEERGAYLVEGAIEIDGILHEPGKLLVFHAGRPALLHAKGGARIMLLGGAKLDGPRHIEWNFVSSSRERIEQAKADWVARRFAAVPGETEFIPLPGSPQAPVNYP